MRNRFAIGIIVFFSTISYTFPLFAGGPIVLKRDVAIQNQIKYANTLYIIRDELDLKGLRLTMPNNCILRFEGGSLNNGSIIYSNTYIEGRYIINCKCDGNLANDIIEPHMYGAVGDGKTDDSQAIQHSVNSGKQVLFRRAKYRVESPIVFDRQNFIVDFNFSTIVKNNKIGYNYSYKSYDYSHIPCVFLIKPYESNTSGHIVLKNLIIDGGGVNCGIHAIWCRNVILDNIRIYSTTQGVLYGGFTNTLRDITVWASKEGFVLQGGNATLFERCFSSNCGWRIENMKGVSLVTCSSDDYNPCYSITNSTVSMHGCTFESKGTGMVIKQSVVDISGDYETHIYDSTKGLTYLKVSDNSVVRAKCASFHLGNYNNKKVPSSNIFDVSGDSMVEIEGEVIHGTVINAKISSGGKIKLNGKEIKNGKNTINR